MIRSSARIAEVPKHLLEQYGYEIRHIHETKHTILYLAPEKFNTHHLFYGQAKRIAKAKAAGELIQLEYNPHSWDGITKSSEVLKQKQSDGYVVIGSEISNNFYRDAIIYTRTGQELSYRYEPNEAGLIAFKCDEDCANKWAKAIETLSGVRTILTEGKWYQLKPASDMWWCNDSIHVSIIADTGELYGARYTSFDLSDLKDNDPSIPISVVSESVKAINDTSREVPKYLKKEYEKYKDLKMVVMNETKGLSLKSLNEILSKIQYKDWTFFVEEQSGGFILSLAPGAKSIVEWVQANPIMETKIRSYSRKWYISSWSTVTEVVRTCFKAVTDHENKFITYWTTSLGGLSHNVAIDAAISGFKYKPTWEIVQQQKGDVVIFKLVFMAPDNITGAPEKQDCRKYVWRNILEDVVDAVRTAEEHERCETFKYCDVDIYNPHISTDALAVFAKAKHVDVRPDNKTDSLEVPHRHFV